MKVEITTDDLLTIEEAAKEIGCHRATIFRWIDEGKILTLKLAKNRAIPKAEVERLRRLGAKRKYERHKATGRIPKVLQPSPVEETPIGLPKVKIPHENPFL